MKVKVKKNQNSTRTTFCVVNGHFDEHGEYNENYYQSIPLSRLPKEAKCILREGYDVTVRILPGLEITYFFKDWNTADQYLTMMEAGSELFELTLHAFSAQEFTDLDEPIWSPINLEDLE